MIWFQIQISTNHSPGMTDWGRWTHVPSLGIQKREMKPKIITHDYRRTIQLNTAERENQTQYDGLWPAAWWRRLRWATPWYPRWHSPASPGRPPQLYSAGAPASRLSHDWRWGGDTTRTYSFFRTNKWFRASWTYSRLSSRVLGSSPSSFRLAIIRLTLGARRWKVDQK